MITHSELIENWQRMDAASRQANTEAWLAELATWKQRAETAEAKLAHVDEYASYYAIAWETFEADSDGPEPLDFAEWLEQQSEIQL